MDDDALNIEPAPSDAWWQQETNRLWAIIDRLEHRLERRKRVVDAARVVATNSHSNQPSYVELRQALREHDEEKPITGG